MLARIMPVGTTLFRVFSVATLAALFPACPSPPEARAFPYPPPEVSGSGQVVARIGPVSLTTDEIERRLAAQSAFLQQQISEPEKLRTFVENQVRMEILAQEGWDRGLAQDPQVLEGFRRVVVERLTRDALEEAASQLQQLTDADLQAAYEARQREFNRPPTVRVSYITRKAETADQRDKALDLLRHLQKEIREKERKNDLRAFSRAARAHSEEPRAQEDAGDAKFLKREALKTRFGEEIADRLFDKTAIGEMFIDSRPDFVTLYKKTGQRRGLTRTLEQVKPQIRARLAADKRTEAFDTFINGLKEKHGVTIDEAALDQLHTPSPEEPGDTTQQ